MSQPSSRSKFQPKRAAVPPGYVLHKRKIQNQEVVCFVPHALKAQIDREDEQRRLRELEDRLRADAERANRLRAHRELAERERLIIGPKPETAPIPDAPPVRPRNSVAVFDWAAARERVETLKTAPASGDKDVVKRDLRHFEKAMAAGPWRRISPTPGWRAALAKLAEEMPNFAPVTTFVAQRLALAAVSKSPLQPPPILLLGEPGVGKTHFAEHLAKTLGTAIHRHSFDNSQANGALRGSDRHWANTSVGALWELIMLGKHANPVVVLDELDKARSGSNGYRPADELLTLLEPVSSGRVKDQSVNFEFNASHIWYIATANDPKQISAPIRSRFTEFMIGLPDIDARLILANSIYAATLKRLFPSRQIRARFRSPTNLQICRMAWLSPRQIRKTSESVLAAAALAGRWHLEDGDFDAALRHDSTVHSLRKPKEDGGEPFTTIVFGLR